MTETATITQPMRPPVDTHRIAWIVMLIAFFSFCSLSLLLSGGVYYFLFQSSRPMVTDLQVSRGTSGLVASDFTRQFITSAVPTDIRGGSKISTDAQSQAVISFRTSGDDDLPVLATITAENSTSFHVSQARNPRFSWSSGYYSIILTEFVGELDLFIRPHLERAFRMEIHTINGTRILITNPGRYSVEFDETNLRVITREGRALVFKPDAETGKLVSRGEEVTYIVERDIIIADDSPANLLTNSLFAYPDGEDIESETDLLPLGWACSLNADSPPIGNFQPDEWQGRTAIRLLRGNEARSHGQTRCFQDFQGDGVNVSDYSYLEIQTTFLINFQSLSSCGIDGSECPMMLLMYYTDAEGNAREWHQGFYARRDPQVPYPLTCTTCYQRIQEHRRIGEQVWYTYESNNLLTQLREEERPGKIQRLEFYASGHEYDVFVSELALLAEEDGIVPPSDNLVPQSQQTPESAP